MLSIKLSENAGRAPEAVPFMPAGQHSICATVNGKPGRRVVNVDREACERLQADLAEHLRASAAGEKARPMLMFDHTAGNAAAKPLGFEWDDQRGILLRVEWTKAGREAVEGGNYGYISPAFRLARGTGEIMGLAGGVEVGSLVNDPAFERNECIAAARAEEPEEVQVDFVETANPWGCNQHGHREGHEGGDTKSEQHGKNADKQGAKQPEKLPEGWEPLPEPYEHPHDRYMRRFKKRKEDFVQQNGREPDTRELLKILEEENAIYEKEMEADWNSGWEYIMDTNGKVIGRRKKKSDTVKSSASLPPREEVEKTPRAVDNGDVANSGDNNNKSKQMEKQIKEMLGLSPDADAAAVLAAIRALKNTGAEAKAKTEVLEAECDKHKKTMQDYKEKSADAFIKRLRVNGNLAPKDEEKAKAARTLYLTDPEQAETLFCGMKPAAADVLSDKVTANRVTEPRLSAKYEDMSLEDILNETH